MNHAGGVRIVWSTKAELVHDRNWSCTHGQDVADNAADTGCCSLEGFDVAWVVVALHLEGDC